MRRLFWMGVGAAATVAVAQRLRTAWRKYTPEGVAEQVEQAGESAVAAGRSALDTFVQAFRTRERDLTAQLLVTPEGGDPSAVFHRTGKPAAQPSAPTDPAAERARPAGRVDPDEPLYDF
ncbi:hypothetical protein OEB99_09630 [Actinotalea sp. M2MS4P-6]|uniref:hypothetical protein n=1 Tax=Actinotalea sp. M2MS4P-6 TaxID=2983762 RepID=UPI0021E3DDDB|nr:hypothetical protein [Actinotalea sp. M2MS4P-6]MCV2394566.1 hypothetical protein [Actinotalea sp. M2MS4P-6]